MIVPYPFPPHIRRSGSTTLFGERCNWTRYKFALGIETWLLLGYRNKTDIPWASQDCKKNCGEPCFVQVDEDTDNMTATQLERRQVVLSYLGLYRYFDGIWVCNFCHRYCRIPRESIKKQCCVNGMFIPDTGSEFFPSWYQIRIFSIPDPGSRGPHQ